MKTNAERLLKKAIVHGILYHMRRISIISLHVVFCCCILFAGTTQLNAFNLQSSSIATSPAHPEPGKTAVASINTGAFAVIGGSISWFIDGVELTTAKDAKSISFTAPKVGGSTNISALIKNQDGQFIEIQKTVTPLRVDIIISADTYVPHFYKGRALPSSAGAIAAQAFVFSETQEPVGKYSYIWKVNGETQSQNLTRSSSRIQFSPNFETKLPVSVEVVNTDGITVAEKAVSVPISTPEIYIYEANPLRGLMPTALRDSYLFLDSEVVLRAEPYFTEKNSNVIETRWKINSKKIDVSENPYELTLQKQGTSGTAQISFELFNTSEFLQSEKTNLSVSY